MGEAGRFGSGEKNKARCSLGDEVVVWWKAREVRWARRRSRWGRCRRMSSRSSGRCRVRRVAVFVFVVDILVWGLGLFGLGWLVSSCLSWSCITARGRGLVVSLDVCLDFDDFPGEASSSTGR